MRVVLFPTCVVRGLLPQVEEAARRVLAHFGVEVEVAEDVPCCGQPLFNAGLEDEARQVARHAVLRLYARGLPVVVLAGSCTAMLRKEAPKLLEATDAGPAAQALAQRTFEFSEFLVDVLHVTQVPGRFPYTVAYHPSCHMLRGLGVDAQPRRLLDGIEGLQRVPWPEEDTCCGFGGVFSGLLPELAESMGRAKAQYLLETAAQVGVTCDPGCLLHIQAHLGEARPMLHLAEVLAHALRLAGA